MRAAHGLDVVNEAGRVSPTELSHGRALDRRHCRLQAHRSIASSSWMKLVTWCDGCSVPSMSWCSAGNALAIEVAAMSSVV